MDEKRREEGKKTAVRKRKNYLLEFTCCETLLYTWLVNRETEQRERESERRCQRTLSRWAVLVLECVGVQGVYGAGCVNFPAGGTTGVTIDLGMVAAYSVQYYEIVHFLKNSSSYFQG